MPHTAKYEEIFYSSHTATIENLALTVTLDGSIREKQISTTPFHDHPVFEMQAVTEGELLFQTPDDEQISVSKGSICLIPPDFYHLVSAREETKRLTLRFSCAEHRTEGGEDIFSRFANLRDLTYLQDAEDLILLMKKIKEETLSKQAASDPLCRAYLCELFLLLYRRLGAIIRDPEDAPLSKSDDANARYNKIEVLMQQHINEPICEADLARALGLSVRQTSRVVRSIFGMSFRKKLSELRLHYAKGLLITTDIPVEQVATQAGYTTPSGFHVAFRKAFGCTPTEYRERNLP